MVSARIQVDGLQELEDALKAFGGRVYANALGKAVNAGAKPIIAIAQTRVPVDSGLTKESIGCVVRKYPESQVVVAVIGPRASVSGISHKRRHIPANIAHLVEYGHRTIAGGKGKEAKEIRKELRNAKRRLDKDESGRLSAKLDSLSNGFVAPQPFMRPAVDQGKAEAAETIRTVLTKALYEEIAR